MRTDFDFPKKELLGPVVFRPSFANGEKINSNQAWSLFFTAGQDDNVLGQQIELGRFFTNLLIAVGLTGTLLAAYLKNFA